MPRRNIVSGNGAAKHVAADPKASFEARVSAERERAGEEIANVAGLLKQTGEALRESAPKLGDYTEQAAEKLDDLAEAVRTRTADEMIRDVERFARREPALFFGGAFALGLLAARFLRSTPDASDDSSDDDVEPEDDEDEQPELHESSYT